MGSFIEYIERKFIVVLFFMQTAAVIIDFKIHMNGPIQSCSHVIPSLIHLHSTYPLQARTVSPRNHKLLCLSLIPTLSWFYLKLYAYYIFLYLSLKICKPFKLRVRLCHLRLISSVPRPTLACNRQSRFVE